MNEQIKRRQDKPRVRLIRINGKPVWRASCRLSGCATNGETPMLAIKYLENRLEEYP